MSDKEFLNKYEELLKKDYCNCNEMNCIDNNSPRRILNIAKSQQDEIERLNNIINRLEEFIEKEIELYTIELTEENKNKLSIVAPIKGVYKEIYNVLQELKGSE